MLKSAKVNGVDRSNRDLSFTDCRMFNHIHRLVLYCTPLHSFINISFIPVFVYLPLWAWCSKCSAKSEFVGFTFSGFKYANMFIHSLEKIQYCGGSVIKR